MSSSSSPSPDRDEQNHPRSSLSAAKRKKPDSDRRRYERNLKLWSGFSFYSPRVVMMLIIASALLVFYDQGLTYAIVPEVREDPVINAVEGDGIDGGGSGSMHNASAGTRNDTLGTALSTTKAGIFAACFMGGFVIGTPIFGLLANKVSSNRLIFFSLVGQFVMQLATAAAPNYALLILFRVGVGVSEAASSTFMLTVIDNIAPPESKTFWISLYYAMMPLGTALGMAAGGLIAANFRIFGYPGWRLCYVSEAPIGMMLSIGFAFLPAAYNVFSLKDDDAGDGDAEDAANDDSGDDVKHDDAAKQQTEEEREEEGERTPAMASVARIGDVNVSTPSHHQSSSSQADLRRRDNDDDDADGEGRGEEQGVKQDQALSYFAALSSLLCNCDFMCLAFGYAFLDFQITSFGSFATVLIVQGPYGVDSAKASTILGGAIAGCGLVGTILGGVIVDYFGGVRGKNGLSRCTGFAVSCVTVAMPLAICAVMTDTINGFVAFFVPAVLVLTMSTAALTCSVLNVVAKNERAFASGLQYLIMNMFGDMIAPICVGRLSDAFAGECHGISSKLLCEELARNQTAAAAAASAANSSSTAPPWWWHGKCQWNEASLKGQESYFANDSQVNRAFIVGTLMTCAVIPLWSIVVCRRWGTVVAVDDDDEEEEEQSPTNEKTPLL